MKNNAILTVFTPTYNRADLLKRGYEALCRQTCKDFCWLIIDDGSIDNTEEVVKRWISENKIQIFYVYKENGGLHTGYNKAIELMDTELCVCIDSDDWMPDDAVEKIVSFWKVNGSDKYAGIVGLDFYANGGAIGSDFPDGLKKSHIVRLDKYHKGDVKMVHRVELLKNVAPMPSFPGEKFFNPIYLFIKVDMELPMLILNENLCFVDYQDSDNSMSKNILYQFVQSPHSFKQLRLLHMGNKVESTKNRFRHNIHYIAKCIMTKDGKWLSNSPTKFMSILAVPFGWLLYLYIKSVTSYKKNTYQ